MPVHRRLLKGGRHVLGHISGALKQPRPRNEPWQNQMDDPNWRGNPFGAPGIGGEGILLGALPGMAYRGAVGRLPMKFVRNAVKDTGGRMVPQFSRGMRRIDPKLGPPPGAVRPRAAQLRDAMGGAGGGRRINPRDINLGYTPRRGWPRWRGEPYHPRLTPEQLDRMMRSRVLRGTPARLVKDGRPYRPMRNQPPDPNLLQKTSTWFRHNWPWNPPW